MNNDRIRKLIVIAITLVGAVINELYGVQLARLFLDPGIEPAIRQILISAIVLEFGWMALLIWVAFKPFERRDILLFTAATLLAGNFLNSYTQYLSTPEDLQPLVINTLIGLAVSGVFLFAFYLAKPARLTTR